MSGSGTVGIGGTSQATTTNTGPFQPYTVLAAAALNSALQYGVKLGGTIDNTPIGQTTPAAGSFTTLTATTVPAGDNTQNVATTAFVTTAVGSGGGGGGSISLNSPAFTGIPTAPTATSGNSTTQVATTAFVGNALSNDVVGSVYTGSGSAPGLLRDDGTGVPTSLTSYLWSPMNWTPSSNVPVLFIVPTPLTITGFHVEAPGVTTGNSFTITITRNGSQIGSTYTGSGTSTNSVTLSPSVTCAAGDRLVFLVGAITGTVLNAFVQPVGPLG